jgi:hypothetical protein
MDRLYRVDEPDGKKTLLIIKKTTLEVLPDWAQPGNGHHLKLNKKLVRKLRLVADAIEHSLAGAA